MTIDRSCRETDRRQAGERGVAAILLAASLVALLGMVAMVVDLGYAYFERQRLQDSLDLAAISAARELSGQGATAAAYQKAVDTLALDRGGGDMLPLGYGCAAPTVVGTANICFGTYDAERDNNGNRPALVDRFQNESTSCNGCNAVRIYGRAPSPSFFASLFDVTELDIAGVSTAVKSGSSTAQLKIRSTVASIDSSRSALLNAVVGGLLGGNLDLTAVSWNGLLDTEVNLLDYFDQLLSVNAQLGAGSYHELVQLQNLSAGQLLQAAATVLQQGGATGVTADAVAGLLQVAAIVPPAWTVSLGDILSVAEGTTAAGLDVGVSALDLVQGVVQAANGRNALSGQIDIGTAMFSNLPVLNILGSLAAIHIKLAVIEPQQISSIGNPAVASALPTASKKRVDLGAIFVRTAQLRLLIQIDLPILSGLTGVTSAINNLVGPITPVLNSALSLNLFSTLNSLTNFLVNLLTSLICVNCYSAPADLTDIRLLARSAGDSRPPGIDIVVELGGGDAYVDNYECPPQSNRKSLTVQTSSHLAKVQAGQLVNPGSVFSNSAVPDFQPVPIIDVGSQAYRVKKTCLLLFCSTTTEAYGARRAFTGGGLGLLVDVPVVGSGDNFAADVVVDPPDLGDPQTETSVISHSVNNVVASLKNSLAGISLLSYKPTGSGSLLSVVISTVTGLLSTLVAALQPVLTFLGGLLDPILNGLINALGLQIAGITVETNLTCSAGARLVN